MFKVQKLQLFLFMKEIQPDVPKDVNGLEEYIITFFCRYFGLERSSVSENSHYEFESFKHQVESFRKAINKWRTNLKGFPDKFLEKPFLQNYIVLTEKEQEPRVEEETELESYFPDFDFEDGESSQTSFQDYQPRTKRGKSAKLRQTTDQELLIKAVAQNFREKGNKEAADVVERLHENPSELGPHLKKCIQEFDKQDQEEDISELEVLCLVLTENMSRKNYTNWRRLVNKKGKILPPYDSVAKVKKDCRPIGITSELIKVDVPLQNLAEHTVKRILQDDAVAAQVNKLAEENGGPLEIGFNFKLGTDGTNGLQTLEEDFEEFHEETRAMVATTFVALNIWTVINNKIKVVYHNPLFNSPLAVRPKQHLYRREDDVLDEVLDELKEEMENLQPIVWEENEAVKIKFVPFFSMNDGKVMNHLHGNNWTNACPICYAGPERFSDINSVYSANPEALAQLCLSTLHFGPRVMENLLKVGFNKDFQKSQAITDEHKRMRAISKEHIISEVKRVLKQDVFKGQSNTGNCARTLFKNSIFFADLIGVDEDLVHRIYMIWIALTSALPIDPKEFYNYCQETKDLYFEQCGWYNMSPTLHKVLEHGHQILQLLPPTLTAGMLSEEPAEASNKDVKFFQKYHTFQGVPKTKNLQVFHRMMDRSDPLSHSLFLDRHVKAKPKHDDIPEDVQAMCFSDEELQNRMIVKDSEPKSLDGAPLPSFAI